MYASIIGPHLAPEHQHCSAIADPFMSHVLASASKNAFCRDATRGEVNDAKEKDGCLNETRSPTKSGATAHDSRSGRATQSESHAGLSAHQATWPPCSHGG